jgi:hypothetical protein
LSEDDLDADAPLESDPLESDPLESDDVFDSEDDDLLLSDDDFESLDVFADESPDELPLPLAAVALDSDESALPVAFLA